MGRKFEEEEFDDLVNKEEELDEDLDDMPLEEQSFLRGYEEEAEDPEREVAVVEEEFEY
jgi:hypothetical protein